LLNLALEMSADNPDGPGYLEILENLRQVVIPAMRTELRSYFDLAAESLVDEVLKGDMQIYRFKATAQNPGWPGFRAGIAEVRNGIDVSELTLGLGLSNMPSGSELFDIAKDGDYDSLDELFSGVKPNVSLEAPIKFAGTVHGSISAEGTGVTIGEMLRGDLHGSITQPGLKVKSAIAYEREIDRDIFGYGRFRGLFRFNISGSVSHQFAPNGTPRDLFDHSTNAGIIGAAALEY
jgi:hypothetical protein